MPCKKVTPNDCHVSGSSYNLLGSGSSAVDHLVKNKDCEPDVVLKDYKALLEPRVLRTLCSQGRYNVAPFTSNTQIVVQIQRDADCGIVLDLTSATDKLIADAELAFPASVVNDPTNPTTDYKAYELTIVNMSNYPVYAHAATKNSSDRPFEGVSRNIGVRPGESLIIHFDGNARQWMIASNTL